MIPGSALLVAGALIGQTVEQIPQPTRSPPAEHAHGVGSDTLRVAQVPPEATERKPDTNVDVARAYAALLANGSVAPGQTPDLGARTVAEAAAAAGLAAAPQPAAKPTPPATPTP